MATPGTPPREKGLSFGLRKGWSLIAKVKPGHEKQIREAIAELF